MPIFSRLKTLARMALANGGQIAATVLAAAILLVIVVFAVHGDEHYEMNQAESVRGVHLLDTALVARQQAEQATSAYNEWMTATRKAHNWPDDLVFDGNEWKHAPKAPAPAATRPVEPKK